MTKNNKIIAKKQEINQENSLITESYAQIYSWPIPSPEDLEKYEKIRPWFAEEFLEMAKKEQNFRHTEISRVNKFEVNSGYLWIFISFSIFLIAILVSWFLIYLWKSIEAIIALISTILIFAKIFIKWRNIKEESKEIEKQ